MPTILKPFNLSKIAGALALLCLLLSLSACGGIEKTAIKVEKRQVPDHLLDPVPLPALPDITTLTDNEIGILIQEDGKAIEACNARLLEISDFLESE